MTNRVNQSDSGERSLAVCELAEEELDLVVGGEKKKTEKKKDDSKKTSADYMSIELTNVMVTSY